MILAQIEKFNKPICPTFVHDETTRMLICMCGVIILGSFLCWILNKMND